MAGSAKRHISTKRVAIDKAAAQMVAIVAITSFVTVFSLMAANTIFQQNQYRSRVIDAKEQARDNLKSNVDTASKIVTEYRKFDRKNPNAIGGQRDGAADNDGSNAKIVLDALPSTYDFPALTSSIEKILKGLNFNVTNIAGTDEQLDKQDASAADPKPQPVTFSFSVANANYAQVQSLVDALDRSIRPIQITKLSLGGAINDMDLTVEAQTYYQPGKTLKLQKKPVR